MGFGDSAAIHLVCRGLRCDGQLLGRNTDDRPPARLLFGREEKRLTGWKQGHTPVLRFRAPAFGGGFFLSD